MKIMTLKMAAEYLGCNAEVLRRKAVNGTIPAVRIGNSPHSPWRFYREELDQYLEWEKPSKAGDQDQEQLLREKFSLYLLEQEEAQKIKILCEIGELKDAEAIPLLCEIMLDSANSNALVIWAIRALVKITGKEAERYLRKFCTSSDVWLQLEISRFYALYFRDETALKYLDEYYRKTGSFPVLQMLLEIAPAEYCRELDTLLLSSENITQTLALKELRKISHPREIELIKPFLAIKDVRLRKLAITLTGEKKIALFIPELQNIISSKDSNSLKKLAAQALLEIFS